MIISKKNIGQYRLLLICCLIVFLFSCNNESEEQVSGIIPHPNTEKILHGNFLLTENTVIIYNNDDQKFIAELLQKDIKNHQGIDLEIAQNLKSKTNTISLSILENFDINNAEAYNLNVKKKEVEIEAKDLHGLFYGVQSLLQLIPHRQDSLLEIPCLTISDQPEFPIRGILFDVSHHFFSVEFMKRIIDVLAMHKMNTLILHLTDDCAWRIEIKEYPKLTEVGAWREDRRDEEWSMNNGIRKAYPTNKPYYGAYYSQKEMKEIIDYASKSFVDIIPEVDLPGKAQALLASYPELSCSGEDRKVISGQYWGMTEPLCVGNDSTMVFIKNVLSEVIDMFPSKYLLLGGAETFTFDSWQKCKKCQNKIEQLELQDEVELNANFINQINSFVTRKGKKVIGTNIYAEFNISTNPVILNVISEEETDSIINNFDSQVINMHKDASFSNYQAFPDDELIARSPVKLLFDFYRSNNIPSGIPKDKHDMVLGSVKGVWTWYIQTPEMAEYMLLPRLCALSESLWTSREKQEWEHFTKSLENHYSNLDKLNLNYHIPVPEGVEDDVLFNVGMRKLWLSAPIENSQIRYTLDNTEPTINSTLYTNPISIEAGLVLKAKTFLANGKSSTTKVARYAEGSTKEGMSDPVNLYPGLKYQYYEGHFNSTDDFLKYTPLKNGVINNISILDEHREDNFGVIYSGLILINREGVYTFYLTSDDGSRLYIDDDLLIDNDNIQRAHTKLGQIGLYKGYHKIKVEYFDYNNLDSLALQLDGPSIRKSESLNDYLFHQK